MRRNIRAFIGRQDYPKRAIDVISFFAFIILLLDFLCFFPTNTVLE
jgi:hypothetical protein